MRRKTKQVNLLLYEDQVEALDIILKGINVMMETYDLPEVNRSRFMRFYIDQIISLYYDQMTEDEEGYVEELDKVWQMVETIEGKKDRWLEVTEWGIYLDKEKHQPKNLFKEKF